MRGARSVAPHDLRISGSTPAAPVLVPRGAAGFFTGFVALVVLLPGTLTPQTIEVPSEVTCPACSLQFERITRLGVEDGEGALEAFPLDVARDESGRFYVLSAARSAPAVFDSDGKFLSRLGRVGQGPREFRWPLEVVVLPGDSLLVIDGENQRMTILSATHELVGMRWRRLTCPGFGPSSAAMRRTWSSTVSGTRFRFAVALGKG